MYVMHNIFSVPNVDTTSMTNNLFFMLSTVVITISFSYLRYSQLKSELKSQAKLQAAQVVEIHEPVTVAQEIAQSDSIVSVKKVSSGVAGLLEQAFNTMLFRKKQGSCLLWQKNLKP